MTKSLTSLWLKSLRRVGKAQQTQSRKLLKSLLAPAAGVPPKKRLPVTKVVKVVKAVKAVKVKQPSRPSQTAAPLKRPAVKARAKPAAAPTPAAIGASAWPAPG